MTITATAAPTLWAPVEVLDDLGSGWVRVRTLPGGVGGWATPGEEFNVRGSLLSNDDETREPAPQPPPLTAPIDGEAYMQLLLQRQADWAATRWPGGVPTGTWLPLLESFIQAADEEFVQLLDRVKRERPPRTYRSAASLREERVRVDAQIDALISKDGSLDGAAVNLSPYSRSRAAASAGRRRFKTLDRDVEKSTALRKQLSGLDGRIMRAEAREARATQNGDQT